MNSEFEHSMKVNMKHVLREQGYILFYRRKGNKLMNKQLKDIKIKGKQVKNEEKLQGVDENLLTKDYFTNNCSNKNSELGLFADRMDYVKVPQLATRPELNDNKKKLVTDGDEVVTEIFWPPMNLE